MPTYFPCPNTGCSYQFDADQLPAAAMVTCPLCRTKFPYRAAPVATEVPDENEDDGTTERRSSPKPNRLVNPRFTPKKNNTQLIVLAVAGIAAVGMLIFVFINTSRKKPFNTQGSSGPQTNTTYNFIFDVPADWEEDEPLRKQLSISGFAYRAKDRGAYFALHALDFKDRSPRPNELREEFEGVVKPHFVGFSKDAPTSMTFGGKDAQMIPFQGELEVKNKDGELEPKLMNGEAVIMDYKGIGYVFLTWAPADAWADRKPDLNRLRDRFKVADGRENWKGTSSVKTYNEAGGTYEISDIDGIWTQSVQLQKDKDGNFIPVKKKGLYHQDLADYDPNASMFFVGKYPVRDIKRRRDLVAEGFALVMVIKKPAGDVSDAVKKYVIDRRKRQEGMSAEIGVQDVTKSPSGTDIPKSSASILRFITTNSEDREAKKFFVVSYLEQADKVVIVETYCKEIESEWMEPYLLHLAASLQQRK